MSDGELLPVEGGAVTGEARSAGPVVVVTAVHLSVEARAALAEELGPGHVVRDIREAGSSADIVLVSAISGQAVGKLRSMFPGAKLLVGEFADDQYGVDVVGPLRRTLETGIDGYFVAPDLAGVAQVTRDAALGRPIGVLESGSDARQARLRLQTHDPPVADSPPGDGGSVGGSVAGLKDDLWTRLRDARAAMLAALDGLSEYDRRRPMTPSGTNLLGLVKHLAGEEYGYLGETFGRPPGRRPRWFRDDPSTEIDMWALPDEPSDEIVGVYLDATAHADETIRLLDLNSPGRVEHWAGAPTDLGAMLVLMVGETAQHAGHADILRELVVAADAGPGPADLSRWSQVQAVADQFR